MKKAVQLAALSGTVTGILIAAGIVCGLRAPDWAAWVQALGSIAAIVAAVFIASDQHRQNVKREARAVAHREARLLGVPLAVAERALNELERCANHARKPAGGDDWGASADYLPAVGTEIERFAALPLQELSYMNFKSAYEILDQLRQAHAELERVVAKRDQQTYVGHAEFHSYEAAVGRAKIFYKSLGEDWVQAVTTADRI